jgi:hypothetical protein
MLNPPAIYGSAPRRHYLGTKTEQPLLLPGQAGDAITYQDLSDRA